jgi:hypothetical protein
MTSSRSRSRIFVLLLAGLSMLGALFIWCGTFWGPWAFSDGVGYLVNARNLVVGRGLGLFRASGDFVLLVTHPPLYPWLLAGLGKTGVDLVTAARWIDVVLFGLFLFATGYGFFRVSRSAWLALSLTAVFLFHPALLLAYLSAMSEPLFLVCIVTALLLMADYMLTEDIQRLRLSAVAAAGALFTRYPGAAVIITAVGAIWLLTAREWRLKARDSLLYLSISVVPTLGFVLWTRFVLGARNPRGIKTSYDLLSLVTTFTKSVAEAVWSWKPVPPEVVPNQFLPTPVTQVLAGALAVLLGIGFAWLVLSAIAARRRMEPTDPVHLEWRPTALFALFLLSYLGFFGAAYVMTNPTPDVDARTLLPLLPGGILLVFALADVLRRSAIHPRLFRSLFAVALVASVAGWSIISQDMVLGLHRTGLGYTSKAWRASETMQAVERLPADLALVSNETAAILLYTDRSAYELPGLKAGDSQPLSVPFGSGNTQLDQDYRDGQVALVLFDTVKGQLRSGPEATRRLSPEDLTLGLDEIFAGRDGAIYCRCSLP